MDKMNIQNATAAKIMGEILAKGMSLSDINLADSINADAAEALEEIRTVVSDDKRSEKQRVREIKRIIKNRGIY
ncbi:MAG: hypothetical protein IJQ28_02940 [Clostridia bacterium]|nr:hypothetical protein [Clostridia bacterium]